MSALLHVMRKSFEGHSLQPQSYRLNFKLSFNPSTYLCNVLCYR